MKTVIKFSYEGCQPCKLYAPAFTKVAHELSEQYQFVEIDVDQKPDVASSYRVRSVPTTIITDESDIVLATKAGVMSEQQLKEFIQGCSNN
jgi:thioredoxin 1